MAGYITLKLLKGRHNTQPYGFQHNIASHINVQNNNQNEAFSITLY